MDRTHPRTPFGTSPARYGPAEDRHSEPHRPHIVPETTSEPSSRPLLDRLTQAGWGRWIPLDSSSTGPGRNG